MAENYLKIIFRKIIENWKENIKNPVDFVDKFRVILSLFQGKDY